jgi:hypothetical protein
MTTKTNNREDEYQEESEKTADDLAEYLERLRRITPAPLPEWTD